FFFFQAEDGIRDGHVTGVQTCALPISKHIRPFPRCLWKRSIWAMAYCSHGGGRDRRMARRFGPRISCPALGKESSTRRTAPSFRSEERRVGKECRSWWVSDHEKQEERK